MPYFQDQLDKDKEVKLAGGNVQSPVIGAMSAGAMGAPSGAASDGVTKSQGSGFTNIDKYLQANDSKGFGQEVTGLATGSIDQAGKGVDAGIAQVGGSINSSGIVYTPEEIDGFIKDPTEENIKKYNESIKAKYTGPKSLADDKGANDQVVGGVASATGTADSAGTESGRFDLLDQYFGRANYTGGEHALDNMLLQNGGGLDVQGLKAQADAVKARAEKGGADIKDASAKRQELVKQTRKSSRDQIGIDDAGNLTGSGALGASRKEFEDANRIANEAKSGQYSDYGLDLNDDALNESTLKGLGIGEGQDLYDLDLKSYLKQSGAPVSFIESATPEQVKRYLALTKMAQVTPTAFQESDIERAGKRQADAPFDIYRFSQDIAQRGKAYESEMGGLNSGDSDAQTLYNQAAADLQRINAPQRGAVAGQDNPALREAMASLDARRNEEKAAFQTSLDALKAKYKIGRKASKETSGQKDGAEPRASLKKGA